MTEQDSQAQDLVCTLLAEGWSQKRSPDESIETPVR